MTFPNISADILDLALRAAFAAAEVVKAVGKQDAYCGFATLHVKIRKNHKLASVFIKNGWRWDDYRKTYYLYPNTGSQSMTLKEDMMYAAGKLLREQFDIPNHVESRAD